MRRLTLCFALISSTVSRAQSFYDKIMEMNVANADTSNDRAVLDMSAKAMDRVSKGMNNGDAAFHMALCFVRMTGISLELKDTVGAKKAFGMSSVQLKKTDTANSQSVEIKTLRYYHKINELRIGKQDTKKIKVLEAEIESFKNSNPGNPRIYLVNAYYYKCFYATNKTKRKKALELLSQSEKLFALEKPQGYAPRWGKKWRGELVNELSVKPK